uniref:Putative nuclease HARBI1 n=1 Tax=Fundulus heteroclitus TaxID=8078 RepID=A0A3Q2Q6M9_FUNHE
MAFPAPVWLAVQDELLSGGEPEEDCGSRSCFDDFTDEALFETFHLSRPCIAFITDAVRMRVKSAAFKKSQPPVDVMLMAALNYYALGTFTSAVQVKAAPANLAAMVSTVSGVIAGMSDVFISFPLTAEARTRTASKMQERCGIPGVLGVLAPAHFKIRASPYDKETFKSFINSLGYTSVVSQFICDSEGNILSVEKCCVGSTFEQELWDTSFKGREVEDDLHGAFWLIGGKGYHLSRHVLTPVPEPANQSEARFNEAHGKMHQVMHGMLCSMKRRFRCLLQLGFVEEASLNKKSNIIKACSVLHNIAQKFSVPLPPAAGNNELPYPGKPYSAPAEISQAALQARQELIDRNFCVPPNSRDASGSNHLKEDV